MPIPQPHDGEPEQDFVSRCMGNGAMQEYDQQQRAAICYSTFQDHKKSAAGGGTMRLYGTIEKVEPQDDGTVKVHGIATTEAVDDQGEIVRADAMRGALPDYMRFPAIREMHQLAAAGTALEAEVGDDNITRIVAHVVDPIAVKKVKNQVYRGFSIGGRVLEREAGNPKTITRLALSEISLVDRPANPEAVYDVWKASTEGDAAMADGGLGTLGDKFAEAIAKQAPLQKWDCGDPAHQHVKKEDAQKCMAAAVAKADAKPTSDPKAEANTDGDKDKDDGYGPGSGKKDDDVDDDKDKAAKAEDAEKKAADGDSADKPYGDVTYADPGYRGKKRYPIDTEGHVRAAWSYINMPKNAKKYSSDQLASIKSKIRAAAKKHGIDISAKVADGGDEDEIANMSLELINYAAMLSDVVIEKAGRRQSAADHFLMNVAHDAIGKLTDGQWCSKSAGNATQDTSDNPTIAAPNVTPPSETFTPGQNSTQDTSKRGARHSSGTLGNLKKAHDAMCMAGAMCGGDMSKASTTEGAMAPSTQEIEKTPGGDSPEIKQQRKLRKAFERSQAEVGELKEMMKAMADTIGQIAKQPIPAQAAGVIPPGITEVSKSQDGKSADHQGAEKSAVPLPTEAEQWECFKGLSERERFDLLYRSARDRPYVQRRI